MSTQFSKLKVLLPLLLIVFIDEMGNGLFFPLLTPLLLDPAQSILHHSASMTTRQIDYGLTLAVFPLMMFLSAPILGDLSDHFGRKKILIISLIGTVIGYLISAIGVTTQNFPLLLAGRVLDGLTAGNFPIAQAAIIDVSKPEEKTANLSLMVFAISLGFIVGPAAAGILANPNWGSWFGLSTPLYAAALLGMLNVTFILFGFRETFFPKEGFRFNLSQSVRLFTAAFTNKNLRLLSLALLALLFAWGSYIQYSSIFLYREYHFGNELIAMFMVVMALALALASLVVIRILQKFFDEAQITLIALVGAAAGVFLTVSTYKPIYAWIGLVPPAMGIALAHASIMSLFSNQVDETQQGWVMGVTGSIVSLAIMLSAIINIFFGILSPRDPFWVSLISYMVAIIFILMHIRRNPNH